jgi:hypothetical protein
MFEYDNICHSEYVIKNTAKPRFLTLTFLQNIVTVNTQTFISL